MVQQNNIEEHLLKIFDLLRFPLIIGVMFIHNGTYDNANLHPAADYVSWGMPWLDFHIFQTLKYIISEIISRTAVPIFFFISGYLFFFKVRKFTISIYKNKLQRRVRSLLIPYLIWNLTLLLLLYLLYKTTGKTTSMLKNPFSSNTIFDALIGQGGGYYAMPLIYPMWFVRDLIVCVLISPVIYFLTTRLRFVWVLTVASIWTMGYEIPVVGRFGMGMAAICFFSIGAYCSLHRINVCNLLQDIKYAGVIWPVLIVMDILSFHHQSYTIIHNVDILVGIISIFIFTDYLISRRNIKPMPFLTSSTFFIFVIHEPIMLSQIRIALQHFTKGNEVYDIVGYFMTVILALFISLCIYVVLGKISPNLMKLLSGGR